jgi:glycosyltransferase involved in cell wall biosynthesis
VPSEFSKRIHWDRVGLHCNVLPYIIDPKRVVAEQREPKYLTFINPQPTKGVFWVARIIEQLARRRPEIPILIVESRARAKDLEKTGLDLSWCRNMFFMKNTHDPRKFYKVSKAVLMPSLWNESFGLVAAEAMAGGVPVLASNRGALPEVVGDAGLLFDIPAHYQPDTAIVPSADEVEPWIDAILRLWDDPVFYKTVSDRCRLHARQWHPDRLGPLYADFFRNVHPQPGPPLVPRKLLEEGK